MNFVIASMVYETTRQIINAGGVDGCRADIARRIQRRAIRELEVASTPVHVVTPSSPDPSDDAPASLIDDSVTVTTLTRHLRQGEPFTYARFCDGEWLSMLGERGRNCDGHAYLPGTLGSELRESLDQFAILSSSVPNVYVGLLREWLQGDIQHYLRVRELTRQLRWVECHLLQAGLRDLSTRKLLDAIREYRGPKYLVANRQLRAVAKALGCHHVTIPRRNCYVKIDRAERACDFRGPGLVLICAGMAAECLIARRLPQNRQATYIDCGHIFDVLVNRPSRYYTKQNTGGIVDFLQAHYAPLFVGPSNGHVRSLARRAREWIRPKAND